MAAPAAKAQCIAKAYNGKERVFKQCSHNQVPGSTYCFRHKATPPKHGDWVQPAPVPAVAAAKAHPAAPPAALAPPPVPVAAHPAVLPAALAPPLGPAAVAPPVLVLPPQPLKALLPISWAEHVEVGLQLGAKPKSAGPAVPPQMPAGEGEPALKKPRLDVAALAKICSPSQQSMDAVRLFSGFCTEYQQDLLELPEIGELFEIGGHQMFLSDIAVAAWLQKLLEVYELKKLYGQFTSLKKGLLSFNINASIAPHWLQQAASTPPAVTKILKAEKADTLLGSKPVQEKGFLTRQNILDYCLSVIEADYVQPVSQKEICNAFLAWAQAGRGHRITNLAMARLGHVGSTQAAGSAQAPGPEVPYIDLPVSKLLGTMTGKQIVDARVVVRFWLADPVSQYLCNAWLDSLPEDIKSQPGKYLFPHQGITGFNFDKAISNGAVKDTMLAIALQQGLVKNDAHGKTFGCNAIRKGIAAEVVTAVEETLGQLNLQHGRGRQSRMDPLVYCPPSVIVQPGNLHVDIESIQAYFDQRMHQHQVSLKDNLLCSICGYPSCLCPKCLSVLAGKAQYVMHDCWLSSRGRGKKAKDWIHESADQAESRAQAWVAAGVQDLPIFKNGKFTWAD